VGYGCDGGFSERQSSDSSLYLLIGLAKIAAFLCTRPRASVRCDAAIRPELEVDRTRHERPRNVENDP
jgi:hypothetical protein